MTSPFPASYSTLCPVALSAVISAAYGLEDLRCKLLVRGVGDTYLVESAQDRFILRVYRSSHRSLPQIKEEVALLLALKRENVSVSFPVAGLSGETILTVDALEGERHAVLFSYAPGEVVKSLNEEQLHSLGGEMARFHNVSSQISLGGTRRNFDAKTTLLDPVLLLKPAFAGDPEGYNWLQGVVKIAEDKLNATATAGFSNGYCHFDFLPKNFHFENSAVTFFDFDFMGYGWLVNDIMSFWQHLVLDVYTGRMTRDAADKAYRIFLDAYRAGRAVSDEELAAVPYLSLGFWLFYMGFHTTHDQFYAFSQPKQVKSYTGIIKHIVKTYWRD